MYFCGVNGDLLGPDEAPPNRPEPLPEAADDNALAALAKPGLEPDDDDDEEPDDEELDDGVNAETTEGDEAAAAIMFEAAEARLEAADEPEVVEMGRV